MTGDNMRSSLRPGTGCPEAASANLTAAGLGTLDVHATGVEKVNVPEEV